MDVGNVNSKHFLLALRVKSILDPCEDENDDIQDDDVSLGADSAVPDSSDSDSEVNHSPGDQYIVAPVGKQPSNDDEVMVDEATVKALSTRKRISTPLSPLMVNLNDIFLVCKERHKHSTTRKLNEREILLKRSRKASTLPKAFLIAVVEDLAVDSSISTLYAIYLSFLQPLSILCHSFHDIDTYTTGFPRGNGQGLTNIFRVVKHCLPGPYTFILPASKELPKQCIRYGTSTAKYASRKKNVGVRMPADVICQAILEKMGSPLISTSVKWPKEDDWMIDPVVIADVYGPEGLDFVVDGGVRVADPSTVVDMTRHPPTIIRQGKGPKLDWMVAKDDKDSAELQVSSAQIF
ncbi:hypothetical protein Scep_020993 [Stephania cephalantha]|uniref:Threonylcarbamoyl-AMP synthase n=1 Tax=Stephania cephalantha TaxID=152367 RepID=A0AAP0F3I3_9MAGN